MEEKELLEPACQEAAKALESLKLSYLFFQRMPNEYSMRENERKMFEDIETVIKVLDALFDCVAISLVCNCKGEYSLFLDDTRLNTNTLPITKKQAEVLSAILSSREHMDRLGY